MRLAELRLWLEVIAAEPDGLPAIIAPLPNLDALIRQGDSLRDPVRGVPFRPVSGFTVELGQARTRVIHSAGPEKTEAVRNLRRLERELALSMVRQAIETADRQIEELLDAGRGASLFGERRGLTLRQRAALAAARESRATARRQLRGLERSGAVPWFQYPVHFADVAARGGFDLVLGNPPWVRAEALEPQDRRYLSERFGWFRPVRSGGRGYGHLPDLSVAFLERALELVAPGGVVAFLVPAKLATAGYARPARDALARTLTILTAADLRADSRSCFDATVYPLSLMIRREAPPARHRVRLALREARRGDPPSVPQTDLAGPAWELLSTDTRRALSRLRSDFPLLGERFTCQLGVKTGCNRAFLDPPDFVEAEVVRWAVRGRDVEPFQVRPVRRILWPCDQDGRALETLPPGAACHLERFARELRGRSDHRTGTDPLWTMFRTRPASARYRVVWADLDRRLTAVPLLGRRSGTCIPLNTCYLAPVRDGATALRLAAWLNSTWCRALAANTADPASGGFRRFNARVVSSLPAPPALFGDDRMLELGRAGIRGNLPQSELDARTARLLDLTGFERDTLAALASGSAEPGGGNARAG